MLERGEPCRSTRGRVTPAAAFVRYLEEVALRLQGVQILSIAVGADRLPICSESWPLDGHRSQVSNWSDDQWRGMGSWRRRRTDSLDIRACIPEDLRAGAASSSFRAVFVAGRPRLRQLPHISMTMPTMGIASIQRRHRRKHRIDALSAAVTIAAGLAETQRVDRPARQPVTTRHFIVRR